MNEIELYKTADGQTQVEVKFDNETVWLTQKQMAALFDKNIMTVNEHLKNIYEEGELDENPTIRKSLIVHQEGNRAVKREIAFYNLDVIISVGYRVKSKRGTQFRQWATQRLKDYLVKGFAINQKRLDELQKVVNIIQQTGDVSKLNLNEAKGLLDILGNYTKSFVLLNQFDSGDLKTDGLNENVTYEIKYDEAIFTIAELKRQLMQKKEASNLFGNQKDESFGGVLKTITQTFGGEYLYKSIEEQAANLLYLVIKNHPFSDGNKRIGAFLFIWFLEKNKHRFKQSGELKINDNALTALALLVAQSNPKEKELMIILVMNLIKG
jgi:death-on-curing family protein